MCCILISVIKILHNFNPTHAKFKILLNPSLVIVSTYSICLIHAPEKKMKKRNICTRTRAPGILKFTNLVDPCHLYFIFLFFLPQNYLPLVLGHEIYNFLSQSLPTDASYRHMIQSYDRSRCDDPVSLIFIIMILFFISENTSKKN